MSVAIVTRSVGHDVTEGYPLGGFPREFYEAYGPLHGGYARRKHLYNLYHLLNHLNLFGESYRGQVNACLRLLGL